MKAKVLAQVATLTLFSVTLLSSSAHATSNYTYKRGEYVVVVDGRSPNGQYSVAAHGEGDFGYDHFHIYLMHAKTGKPIGPLEEIKDTLDTGADAFYARLVRRFSPGLHCLPRRSACRSNGALSD